MGIVGAAGFLVMEDFVIDVDPVERCRRGRRALGLDEDPPDDQVTNLGEILGEGEATEDESGRDTCRSAFPGLK